MNKLYNLLVVLLIVSPSALFSQITITLSDFTSSFMIGNTYTSYGDTLAQSVNIGQTGGGNNWDFTSYLPNISEEITYLLPSETPYADSFAAANLASYMYIMFDAGDSSSGMSETWAYFNSSDASNHGNISMNTFIDMNDTNTSKTISHHYPPFIEHDFPLAADKMWETKDSSVTTIYSGSPIGFSQTSTTSYSNHVDAWGTMTMPSGKLVEALRIREHSMSTSFFGGFPIGLITSVSYTFMGKNGESFSVLAENENPPNSGEIMGVINWANDDVTDVEKAQDIPTKFALNQNYPNPFNPTTKIEYSISEISFVKLTIYDILGNKVEELVNESQGAGNYRYNFNGSHLASGNYIIKLNAGEYTNFRKMTLLK